MKKKEIKKLDKLWSKLVRENFEKCVICGKTGKIDAHHYIGRRNRATRWYLPNGIALCPGHHTFGIWSAHQNPYWFRDQMLDLYGEKWEKEVRQESNKIFKGTYDQVLRHLEGEDDKYTI